MNIADLDIFNSLFNKIQKYLLFVFLIITNKIENIFGKLCENKLSMDIQKEPVVKTYRFKISNDKLYKEMVLFADKNRFLNKTDLKDTYEKWIEDPEISLMISDEEKMLTLNNYDLVKNNISKKIFKSIKYYHIKNNIQSSKCR